MSSHIKTISQVQNDQIWHVFWSGMGTAFILGFLGVVAIIVLCDLVKRARNK